MSKLSDEVLKKLKAKSDDDETYIGVCLSTHGGSNWAPGTSFVVERDKKTKAITNVIAKCGACGEKKKLGVWTEQLIRYNFLDNPIKWLKRDIKERRFNSPPKNANYVTNYV